MTRSNLRRWLKKIVRPSSLDTPPSKTPPAPPDATPKKSRSSGKNKSANKATTTRQVVDNRPKKGGAKRRTKSPNKQQNTPVSNWQLSDFKVPEMADKLRFHDLGLPDPLMHAIHDLGFEYCSPIQAKSLPHSLQGLDIIGKAQTGTGKTAAFLLTIIDTILNAPLPVDRPKAQPRSVILAPTRELVSQISSDAVDLCKHTSLHVVEMIGGAPYDKQYRQLEARPVDILVATPGRLIDFITRQDINLNYTEILVIDEGDRMLDMGFIPQLKRIIRTTPSKEERQTLLFSATFPHDIANLSQQWTYDPIQVEIAAEKVAAERVDQKVYLISANQKFRLLINLLKEPETKLVLIFVNRRDQSQRLYTQMAKAGINVGILTGEIAQQKRTRTLEKFKNGEYQALVATDVMGRGIHVDGISHVINFNLPDNPEDYVHRIGRTGRAEHDGISISFACEKESFQLPYIEEFMGQKLACESPPEHLLRR